MKRFLAMLVVLVLCLVPLHADLTFTQTTTIEGPMAAMMAGKPMVMVTRIKGKKARVDMEIMDRKISSLTDLATKEITVLDHVEKTAQPMNAMTPASSEMPNLDVEVSFKATGQSRPIDGVVCDEHAFKMSFGFGEMMGGKAPPEAAEMMKGMKMVMDGSIWIAKGGPGAAEYVAFQKAAVDAKLTSVLAGLMGGQNRAGLDKLMAAVSEAPGLPYVTEIAIAVDGQGPMVEMMKKQLTGMKLIQKTSSVSTDAVGDELFKVPADYAVKK